MSTSSYEKRISELEIELDDLKSNTVTGLLSDKNPYQFLFENSPEGYAYCQMILEENIPVDFIYLDVNSAFNKLTGLMNVTGKKVSELIPSLKSDNPDILKIYGLVSLEGKPQKFETYLPSLKLWLTISVVCPSRGYFIAIFNDITTERNIKEALKESEESYHLLFENMLSGFQLNEVIVDSNNEPVDFRILEGNRNMEKFTGLTIDEVRGRTFLELVPDADQNMIKRYGYVALTGEPLMSEYYSSTFKRYFRINVYSPRKGLFAVFFDDITNLKLAEQKLLESQEKYKAIIETANTGIGVSKGEICISANKKLQEILGYHEYEIIGRSFFEFFHPEDRHFFLERIKKSESEEITNHNLQARFIRKNGDLRYADVSASEFHINNEIYFQCVIIDITEKKIAEQKLIKSEEKLRTIIETTIEGYCVISKKGRILDVNSAYCEILGYTREELLKMSIVDLETTQNASEIEAFLELLISVGNSCFETIHRCKDGRLVDLEVKASHLGMTDNMFVAFVHDITKRKASEEVITNHNNSLLKLNSIAIEFSNLTYDDNLEAFIARKAKEISGAEVAVFSEYDPVSHTARPKHIDLNSKFLKKVVTLLGNELLNIHSEITDEIYQEMTNDLIGVRKTLHEASFGSIPQAAGIAVQSLLKIDRFIGLVYMIDGKLYGTSLLGMSKDKSDPPREILENFIHLASDALQDKLNEKALRDSEMQYRSFVLNIPGAVYHRRINSHSIAEKLKKFIPGETGRKSLQPILNAVKIEYFNERIRNITGHSPVDFVNNKIKFGDLIHPDDSDNAATNLLLALKDNKEFELEYRIKDKDGNWHWILERGNPYFDQSGNSLMLIGIIYDITDRKNIEVELEQYAYANQELKQFAFTASHQLQEPIRTISNFTKIFEEDYSEYLDSNGLNHLHTIREATKRMHTLMGSLMEFSHLGRNKKLVYTDCKLLIGNVISDLEYIITSSDASIKVNNMPSLYLFEIEIRQLFQNLILNSIKFQSKGNRPKIVIRSEKMDEKWKFSISDNGIGIDPIQFVRIFDIFQRLHADEEEFEGKGIGLAYCKKIVQLHQGEIWVESKPGHGATFCFTIPTLNP